MQYSNLIGSYWQRKRHIEKLVKREQREVSPSRQLVKHHPDIRPEYQYYAQFKLFLNEQENSVKIGVCVFDSQGTIMLGDSANAFVSLHRWKRQGALRTMKHVEGTIMMLCRMHGIMLNRFNPFRGEVSGLRILNVDFVASHALRNQNLYV